MRNTNSNGNLGRKSATFLALALAASMAFQPVSVSAAAKTAAPKAITVNGEDDIQVLVIGKTYTLDLSSEKVTYKTSKASIATVSKDGVVTAKNRGVVTITATTKSGKKVSKTFYVVPKDCSTEYQKTLDAMLQSSNISKIALRDLKDEESYVIKKADYSDKTLYINAPYSDVKNYATFKQVNIVDVADGTYKEYAKGNSFKITDKKLHFVVASQASVGRILHAVKGGTVTFELRGRADRLDVIGDNAVVNFDSANSSSLAAIKVTGEGAKLHLNADGSVGKIVIDSKAEVKIEGDAGLINIEVTKNAAGATIASSVPVSATVAAAVAIELQDGAEGSEIEKSAKDVALTVKNNTEGDLVITTEGSDKTEVVAPDTTSTPSTPGTSTPGAGVPGSSTPGTTTPSHGIAEVQGVLSPDKTTVTYTLPTSFDNIKSANVKVNVLGIVNEEFTFTESMLAYGKKFLADEDNYIQKMITKWLATDHWTKTEKDSNNKDITVTVDGVGKTKDVTVDGRTASVTVDKDTNTITAVRAKSGLTYTMKRTGINTVEVKGSVNTYTVERVGSNQLVITSTTKLDIVNLVTLTVTY